MSGFLLSIADFLDRWRITRWYTMLIILLLGVGTWKFYFQKNAKAEQYTTAIVEKTNIQNLVTATGILQPIDYVDVGAQVSGQLKKLHVVIGQEVKAGDLLAEIDATVYKAKVNGIRAQLQNLRAQLQDKQSQLTLTKIRLDRQQNLQKDEATTQDTVQSAQASYQSAQAQVNAVQAQIQQTEFSLRVEEANLTYAHIYAPMSGTVVSITSRQGQTLNANQQAPTIMRIADLSTMTVQAQVSEADVGKLKLEMQVYFTTLGGKDYRWYSKLRSIQPTPEISNNVVLYSALFDVPNEKRMLMTQMSAQVFFIVSQAKDALVIPASAVNFSLNKNSQQSDGVGKIQGLLGKENIADSKASEQSSSKSDSSTTKAEIAKPEAKRWKKRELIADDNQPKPAIVQVMDERGNIAERKVVIGIGNRVQVQVLEGMVEGEKVVTGIRQPEKPANAYGGTPPGQGAVGGTGGAARMMR